MNKEQPIERTIRIYQSSTIERLKTKWKEYSNLYSNQNSFIVDLIVRGLESLEDEDNNLKSLKESGNIFAEMKRITALLNRVIDVGYDNYKESYVIGKENQTLISRLYHVVFRLASEKGISADIYNTGALDSLPQNFATITKQLIEEFESRVDS